MVILVNMVRIKGFANAIISLSLSLSLAILSRFTIGIPPEVNMMMMMVWWA